MRDDSCRDRGMWYISLWTLQKPHSLWGAYIMLRRAVCSCMWACAELTEQLWGRLQVKDESSPRGRHQSLMDWHIWEERQREGDRRRARREQTTNTLLRYRVLTLSRSRRVIAVQPSQAHPSTYESSQPRGGKKDMMQCMTEALAINAAIFQKHASYPVLQHHSPNQFPLIAKTVDPWVLYGVSG